MNTLTSPVPLADPMYFIDAYKIDHRRMYPEGTEAIYSNFTPRSSRVVGVDKVVFFGLQAFLTRVLGQMFDPWFAADEDAVIAAYERRTDGVLGPNAVGSEHIRALHRLGYLPLRFNSLPEGTEVPLRVPMFTVENTDPEFFWLTNYIESVLSAEIWLPCTTATLALRMRRLLDDWALATSDTPAAVDWQGHDFSFRGMSSLESAAASGGGHLLAFAGTDSMVALDWIERFYPVEAGTLLGGIRGGHRALGHVRRRCRVRTGHLREAVGDLPVGNPLGGLGHVGPVDRPHRLSARHEGSDSGARRQTGDPAGLR